MGLRCCVPSKQDQLSTNSVVLTEGRLSSGLKLNPGDFIKLNERSISVDYSFGQVLGSGGFGEVRVGIHKLTNSERAIKSIILSDDDTISLEKLLQEVSILKALDHPNVIRIFDVYKNKNILYIVTEVCKGGELFDRIQSMKKFGENQAAKYMLDIVSAIMHCHNQDIVHRDLKPENLLFENDSSNAKLKLIDFGTSRFLKEKKTLKKAIGTCYYIAPEVLSSSYDKKVDVWSLGIILYLMLSGEVPFNGRTDPEIHTKIKNSPISFTRTCWKSISEEAKFLIRNMLKKDPNERYSIDQVYNDPWLQSRGMNRVPDHEIEVSSLLSLANFRTESQLQRAVYLFILSQFVENQHFDELREVFMSIDKNGDGYLSIEEIQQAADKFKFNINILDIIEQCDTDKNGVINYSEFLTATVNKSTAYSKSNLKNAFKRFDKNGDGVISLDELQSSLGRQGGSDTAFKKMIEEADRNEDGLIDFDEFIEHMTRMAEKEILED